jgi:hypothetical protein
MTSKRGQILFSPSAIGFFEAGHSLNIPEDVIEITDDERLYLLEEQSHGKSLVIGSDGRPCAVDRVPSKEEATSKLLGKRNALLSQTDWLVLRHRDESELGLDGITTITHEQYLELQGWRQALRRAPQQAGFPDGSLPAAPTWLESK